MNLKDLGQTVEMLRMNLKDLGQIVEMLQMNMKDLGQILLSVIFIRQHQFNICVAPEFENIF